MARKLLKFDTAEAPGDRASQGASRSNMPDGALYDRQATSASLPFLTME